MPTLAGIPVTDDDTETLVELLPAGEFPDLTEKRGPLESGSWWGPGWCGDGKRLSWH